MNLKYEKLNKSQGRREALKVNHKLITVVWTPLSIERKERKFSDISVFLKPKYTNSSPSAVDGQIKQL
jgi:hypothetical protein